jgi:cyanate permease
VTGFLQIVIGGWLQSGVFAAEVTAILIGMLRDKTGNFSAGLFYVAVSCGVSAVCVWTTSRIVGPPVD